MYVLHTLNKYRQNVTNGICAQIDKHMLLTSDVNIAHTLPRDPLAVVQYVRFSHRFKMCQERKTSFKKAFNISCNEYTNGIGECCPSSLFNILIIRLIPSRQYEIRTKAAWPRLTQCL